MELGDVQGVKVKWILLALLSMNTGAMMLTAWGTGLNRHSHLVTALTQLPIPTWEQCSDCFPCIIFY